MPIKDREKYLKYQREYNVKRKQGCRNLHPESAISCPQPAYTRQEQQGVTTSFTSQIERFQPPIEKTIHISKNTITKNTQVNESRKTAASAKPGNPKTAPVHGSGLARKLDFSQLKIKAPIQMVGAVDRFRSLEEITEVLRKGKPISGEEQVRLRGAGARI